MQPGGSPFIKIEHIHMSSPQQQPPKTKSKHLFSTQEHYSSVSYGIPMVKTQEYGSGTTISIPASVIVPHTVQESSELSNKTPIKFEVKLANASDLSFNYNTPDGTENKQVRQAQQVTSKIFPTQQEENTESMNYRSKIRTLQHSFTQSNMSTHVQANYTDKSLREEKDNKTTEAQLSQSSPSNEKMFELLSQKMTSNMTQPFSNKNFQLEHTESLHTNLTNKETTTFHDRPHLIRMVHEDSKSIEKKPQGNINNTYERSQNKTKTKENNEESLRSLLMDPDSLKAIGIDLETIEFGQGSLPMVEKIASSNSHLRFVQSAPQQTTHIISPSDVYGMLRNNPRSLDSQTTSRGSTADSTASLAVPTNAHISMLPITTNLVRDTFKAQLSTTLQTLHRAPASPTRQRTNQQGESLVSTDTSLAQLPRKSGSSTIQQYYIYPMELFLQFPSHHSTITHPMSQNPYFHQRTPYSPSVAFVVRTIVMPVTDIKDGKL
ncbi:ras guanine nucleotide exchange factor R-like [Anabrus simplex]|uniref:ras guanine nucleotide exchange factor R-like n=1 Tax=Anabrus simplex TaxID=316456 RepID=UPI0035A295F8